MPRSILLGRPWPSPGEPLFTDEDTAYALALAEEERDACPSCGMPKAWCRDNDAGRARFDVQEDFCWATYRVALRQDKQASEKVDPVTRQATRLTARIREGHEPEIDAGLGLGEGRDHADDD